MPSAIVIPVVDHKMRGMCRLPYGGDHPKGCPNYGKVDRCPPNAPKIEDALDLSWTVWAVWNVFDLAAHREKMRAAHSDWSPRQLVNVLYWQRGARAQLRKETGCFVEDRHYELHKMLRQGLRQPEFVTLYTPEACGVNITATMASIGIMLEWPPVNVAYQIALIGFALPKEREALCLS